MDMKTLSAEIKDQKFKRVYLLYGTEGYLREFYKKKLTEAVINGGSDMNVTILNETEGEPDEILKNTDTYPFMADYRLVIVNNSGLFAPRSAGKDEPEKKEKKVKGKRGAKTDVMPKKDFTDSIKELESFAVVIFNEEKVDKRSRLFKAVHEMDGDCELNTQTPATLSKWLIKQALASGKKMAPETASYLVAYSGTDMYSLKNEIEKLVSFTGNREEIIKSDIDAVCIRLVQDQIFAMIDAIARQDISTTMKLYSDLVLLNEVPLKILALIQRQFNILLIVKALKKEGAGNADIASKAGIAPYFVGKYLSLASGYDEKKA
jgi:DNA polymerase-3 subunit delta